MVYYNANSLSNWLVSTFTLAKATAPRYYNDNSLLESHNSKLQSNLASRTLRRQRKGLVMLQPLSCPNSSRSYIWPIRSTLCIDHIRCHGVQLRNNMFSRCQHLMYNNYVPRRKPGTCSMTRSFLSLQSKTSCKAFVLRLLGYMWWVSNNFVFPNDTHHLKHGV